MVERLMIILLTSTLVFQFIDKQIMLDNLFNLIHNSKIVSRNCVGLTACAKFACNIRQQCTADSCVAFLVR